MQFLYGDRELLLKIADIFSASVDVIVNPTNTDLMPIEGLAARILEQGGETIRRECAQFIQEHGALESGMVALSSSGNLPYQAILHAVFPQSGDGDEETKVMQAVSNSLKLCSMHGWNAIAFPDICQENDSVPIEVAAGGFFAAITSFWDARLDEPPYRIIICLGEENFRPFFDAFRQASMMPGEEAHRQTFVTEPDEAVETGVISLDEDEVQSLEGDDVSDWFK